MKFLHYKLTKTQNDQTISILNKNKFLAELGWRDFSYNLLYHYPDMIHKPIQKNLINFWLKTKNLKMAKRNLEFQLLMQV